jgi:hypothetical protein
VLLWFKRLTRYVLGVHSPSQDWALGMKKPVQRLQKPDIPQPFTVSLERVKDGFTAISEAFKVPSSDLFCVYCGAELIVYLPGILECSRSCGHPHYTED